MNTSSIKLPTADSIEPFEPAAHDEFVKEVSAVLRKYNMLDRIGLCLLHRHFDIHPHEILVESTDLQKCVSTLKPVPEGFVGRAELLETMWKLEGNGETTVLQYCGRCGR